MPTRSSWNPSERRTGECDEEELGRIPSTNASGRSRSGTSGSLIDTTTFDEESWRRFRDVMDQSEDVYGSEADPGVLFERHLGTRWRRREGREQPLPSRAFESSAARGTVTLRPLPPSIGSSRWTTRESSTSPRCGTGPRAYAASAGQRAGYCWGSNCSCPLMTPVSIWPNIELWFEDGTRGGSRGDPSGVRRRHTETSPTTTRLASHRGDRP